MSELFWRQAVQRASARVGRGSMTSSHALTESYSASAWLTAAAFAELDRHYVERVAAAQHKDRARFGAKLTRRQRKK